MNKRVPVVVEGDTDPEPTEEEVEFESHGLCFDELTPEEQAKIVESMGSIEKVRANPILNDC